MLSMFVSGSLADFIHILNSGEPHPQLVEVVAKEEEGISHLDLTG
jgi:hypothetical protein